MTDYLALARKAPTAKLRARYLTRHREESLRIQIRSCRACPLNRVRSKAVPWSGPTHGRAELVLVGEAPGAEEDKRGEPFVGAAGRVLEKSLEAAGTTRDKVAILNTLCCRPPSNRDPEPAESAACAPNFADQLKLIASPIGVAMGGYAAAAILGVDRGTIRMQDIRGEVVWRHGMVWSFTYHPAYILRNRNMAGLLTVDLRAAVDVAKGLDDIPLKLADIPADYTDARLGQGVHRHITRKGWATINLRRIGQTITVVRDYKGKQLLPPTAGDYPIFTWEELVRLGELSAKQRATAYELSLVLEMKRAFGATFVR